jgi:hypothetical protein
MKSIYVLEHQEIYQGYHLVVLFNNAFRCGYVGLPVGHKLESVEYDDFDCYVHGGLTYSSVAHDIWSKEGYYWYLGFDCAHICDGVDVESMRRYGASEQQIMIWSHLDGEIKTKDYVLNELKQLVKQIKDQEVEDE